MRQSRVATDAWLYGISATFALLMGLYSTDTAEWHWGYFAVGPFALGAVLVLCGTSFGPLGQRSWRWLVLALVAIGVVAVPLAYETTLHHIYQPEVSVIEDAGSRVVHHQPVYTAYFAGDHLYGQQPGVSVVNSFFPYGPLMAIFGIPSAMTGKVTGLSDARVTMTLFTVFLMLIALGLLRAPPDRKIRTAQFLVVLPTGALFLATGGDDMPILALCLLAVVAMQRRRVVATGLILGVACAMKLTAWPVALALAAVSLDREGRHVGWRVGGLTAAVVGLTFSPYAIFNPRAFLANVFEFPLGLAGVRSPAASPLPGHFLTDWQPWLSHVIMPVVFVAGSIALWRYLRPRWPISPTTSLRVLAVAMTIIICSATATRLGYLIYPINFLVWASVLAPVPADASVDRVVLEYAERPAG